MWALEDGRFVAPQVLVTVFVHRGLVNGLYATPAMLSTIDLAFECLFRSVIIQLGTALMCPILTAVLIMIM